MNLLLRHPKLSSLVYFLSVVILFTLLSFRFVRADGYDRGLFPHWTDQDNNGYTTREDTLIRDAIKTGEVSSVIVSSNYVVSGVWVCPYTGKIITDPGTMDIDHVVPLNYAWEHGADNWTIETREKFANDPDNVLAVTFSANRSKGQSGPTDYLPPNISYIPAYIDKFTSVCVKYNLSCEFNEFDKLKNFYLSMNNGLRGGKINGNTSNTSSNQLSH